jgi:thymidylate synthase (FAD)
VTSETATSRPHVDALDAILGHRFGVLDHGFVRVVDYMGSDDSIVQAARVSYGRGTKRLQEDRALLRYLMRHRHTTPFEMCEIKLHVRVPMDCWRQWIRHRTASVNEYSTRYSEAIDAAQRTAPGDWRVQTSGNKQGSDGRLDSANGETLSKDEADLLASARTVYERRLAAGVAREQARKDLPLSTYTEAYWKIDLHNLFNFLALRMDAHAQEEIRQYASTIGANIVAAWCPVAWQAFLDYRLRAVQFSEPELRLLALLARGDRTGAVECARLCGFLSKNSETLTTNRERVELDAKLAQLGLDPPWSQWPAAARS